MLFVIPIRGEESPLYLWLVWNEIPRFARDDSQMIADNLHFQPSAWLLEQDQNKNKGKHNGDDSKDLAHVQQLRVNITGPVQFLFKPGC